MSNTTYSDNKFNYAQTNYSFENMKKDLENSQNYNSFYVRQLISIRDNGLPTIPPDLKNITMSPTKNTGINVLNNSTSNSTTIDIVNDDNYELIMNQNTMYITGTIACASLIIGAIFLARNE